MRKLQLLWLAIAALGGPAAVAQPKPNVAGDYAGTLGPLSLKLHIVAVPDGSLSGTLDSTDQGAIGIRKSSRTPSLRRRLRKPTSFTPTPDQACASAWSGSMKPVPEPIGTAVVLSNTSIGGGGSFADLLGKHIAQRLAGKPAVSLAF